MLSNSLLLLGAILLAAVFLGDLAERVGVPWITGCILAGVALGPDALGVLTPAEEVVFSGFLQASLALIAFNIGAGLTVAKLRAIGGGVALLAVAQLLAPLAAVLAVFAVAGYSWPVALIVAAIAPLTAPTTTYAAVRRRNATGPFVDRVFAILAINDASAILIFSVVSAAAVAWLGAQSSGDPPWAALGPALAREALSLAVGALFGGAYLIVRPLVAGDRPGAAERLRAMLYALLLLSVGVAVASGLSHLLTPLALGVAIANGGTESGAAEVKAAIKGVEDPLYMVFFVLAGAHLPVADLAQAGLAAAGAAYVLTRLAGKYAAIYLGALALRMDAAARRYLGLCFPAQGGAAMGLALTTAASPVVHALPPEASHGVETAVTIVLIGVLLSQLFGPMIIDAAIRRGAPQPSKAQASLVRPWSGG